MNDLVEMAEEFTETETKQSNFLLKVKAKNARLLKQNQQELTEKRFEESQRGIRFSYDKRQIVQIPLLAILLFQEALSSKFS